MLTNFSTFPYIKFHINQWRGWQMEDRQQSVMYDEINGLRFTAYFCESAER